MKKRLSIVFATLLLLSSFSSTLATQVSKNTVSRGEFIAQVNEAYNFFTSGGQLFTDISLEHPFAYEIMAAKRAGYLSGYPDGSARPDLVLTRLEAAVILSNVANLTATKDAPTLSDASSIPPWALPSVLAATQAKLFALSPSGAFEPNQPLTPQDAQTAIEAALAIHGRPWADEIISATSYDGISLTGRLCMPTGTDTVDKVVLFVNGTGPNTYESRGVQPPYKYKYYDYFADAFAKDGTAFFSYNTRGISLAESFPFYSIDCNIYESYTPQNCAKDIVSFIKVLKAHKALANAEIILLGWSEGAIIAPLAAAEQDSGIDALLLAGYPEANMKDILVWQLDGPQTFFYYTLVFAAEGQTSISREQYEAIKLETPLWSTI